MPFKEVMYISDIQEYEPPKGVLERDIQDRDMLKVMEDRLYSAKSSITYHSEQLGKYSVEVKAIQEEIDRINARIDKRNDDTGIETKEI